MSHSFSGQTANELWLNAVNAFRSQQGYSDHRGRGGNTKELLHTTLELKDPRQRWVFSREPALNIAFAMVEVVWILRGRNDAAFLNYFNKTLPQFAGTTSTYHGAYGHRLAHMVGVNQLERAYQVLQTNPETRQVVLQIWNSATDLPDSNGAPASPDVPCNLLSMLKVREGKLEWTQIMRSNDLFLGFVHNVVQFTCLQEIIAGWLGIEPGTYFHYSDSLHIYERDFVNVQRLSTDSCPLSSDVFSLSKEESDTMFADVELLVEQLIDPKSSVGDILSYWDSLRLHRSVFNFGIIILCEGLRRRNASELMLEKLEECSNLAYKCMFLHWLRRVEGKELSTTKSN